MCMSSAVITTSVIVNNNHLHVTVLFLFYLYHILKSVTRFESLLLYERGTVFKTHQVIQSDTFQLAAN